MKSWRKLWSGIAVCQPSKEQSNVCEGASLKTDSLPSLFIDGQIIERAVSATNLGFGLVFQADTQ